MFDDETLIGVEALKRRADQFIEHVGRSVETFENLVERRQDLFLNECDEQLQCARDAVQPLYDASQLFFR
jgi:hypothetical protein